MKERKKERKLYTGFVESAFVKLRKGTFGFIISVCLSARLFACLSAWNNSASLDGLSLNLIFGFLFRKPVTKIEV
jgi:hypothetical protein